MDEKIYVDLDEVKGNLYFLEKHQDKNFDVTGLGANYLMPYFWDEFIRPMNHKNGLFMYYKRLEDILKSVIKNKGSISRNQLPPNAPEYLEGCAI